MTSRTLVFVSPKAAGRGYISWQIQAKRDNDTSVRAKADGCTIRMGRGQDPMRKPRRLPAWPFPASGVLRTNMTAENTRSRSHSNIRLIIFMRAWAAPCSHNHCWFTGELYPNINYPSVNIWKFNIIYCVHKRAHFLQHDRLWCLPCFLFCRKEVLLCQECRKSSKKNGRCLLTSVDEWITTIFAGNAEIIANKAIVQCWSNARITARKEQL